MQKDVHFYMTRALARMAGIDADVAEKIAWADQFTDDCKKAGPSGVRTACEHFAEWADLGVQEYILVPFHFVPGDDVELPWVVTAGSLRARELMRQASGDIMRIGIALHALQDTYSHQGFCGLEHKINNCYGFGRLEGLLPNVGHAEMMFAPDIANGVWTDPRSQEVIVNKARVMEAAAMTWHYLITFPLLKAKRKDFTAVEPKLQEALKLKYDDRKDYFMKLTGEGVWYYGSGKKEMKRRYAGLFAKAAARHQVATRLLCKDLPVLA